MLTFLRTTTTTSYQSQKWKFICNIFMMMLMNLGKIQQYFTISFLRSLNLGPKC